MLYNAFTKLWTKGDKLAVGNKLGVVSISTMEEEKMRQYAEVAALVTHVTELRGNSNGDLLVECSKWKKNAVRLIEANRGKVVQGWPAVNTKIGMPTVAGFSASNQLCVANTHGYLCFYDIKNSRK